MVAALARAAQLPFTGWLAGLREAPLPVLAAISISLLGGVVLLARVYQLLMVTAHALSVLAVVGAVTAVCLSAACLGSKDIYRLALLSASAQMALAITALGAGGYSAGLLIAFVSAPLSLLLLVTAGSLARAYRTREIASMGGAWRRMRRTSLSLGLWAVAAGGLDLVGYDLVSTVFLNHFPNGGHMTAWVRDLVAGAGHRRPGADRSLRRPSWSPRSAPERRWPAAASWWRGSPRPSRGSGLSRRGRPPPPWWPC